MMCSVREKMNNSGIIFLLSSCACTYTHSHCMCVYLEGIWVYFWDVRLHAPMFPHACINKVLWILANGVLLYQQGEYWLPPLLSLSRWARKRPSLEVGRSFLFRYTLSFTHILFCCSRSLTRLIPSHILAVFSLSKLWRCSCKALYPLMFKASSVLSFLALLSPSVFSCGFTW